MNLKAYCFCSDQTVRRLTTFVLFRPQVHAGCLQASFLWKSHFEVLKSLFLTHIDQQSRDQCLTILMPLLSWKCFDLHMLNVLYQLTWIRGNFKVTHDESKIDGIPMYFLYSFLNHCVFFYGECFPWNHTQAISSQLICCI